MTATIAGNTTDATAFTALNAALTILRNVSDSR
jgi:hypothetical protein